MMFIVKLTNDTWLTRGEGDPPRTVIMDNARIFETGIQAERALKKVRKLPYRDGYPDAQILGVHLALDTAEGE